MHTGSRTDSLKLLAFSPSILMSKEMRSLGKGRMQCGSSIARLNPVPYILRLYRDSNVSTCYMAYPSGGYRSYSIHIHTM
ncbi:hypothetical protein EUGRSUZ_C02601 [Eucalyptus grandis]|uniref:Uncharacterized protein n=2 Tax=Eucalyptus grandis TaxID=71139 RepID=A0ACC3LGI3_EUCGR|nr:hypothetical protein EUGRSUZ_C02601 [Eucalyptus grandis]